MTSFEILDEISAYEYGTIIPEYALVYRGTTITLRCMSSSETSWNFNGTRYINNTNVILIRHASPRNSGRYECYGISPSGESFHSTAHVFVGGKYLSRIFNILSKHLSNKLHNVRTNDRVQKENKEAIDMYKGK